MTKFKPEDAVFGLPSKRSSLHRYAISNEHLLHAIPENMNFESAATLPVVTTTVHEAFVRRCNIQKGDRVLIHAASGGVGMMAIQYCQMIGCTVIATAGDPFKHEILNAMGVTSTTSSRDVDKFTKFMTRYGHVDVVLNSLNGEYIPASIKFLRGGGHFAKLENVIYGQPKNWHHIGQM